MTNATTTAGTTTTTTGTITSTGPAALDSRAAHRATDADAELIARRALGAAMNRLADGDHTPWIPSADRWVVERARALLVARVPTGPELAMALELLEDAAPPVGVMPLP